MSNSAFTPSNNLSIPATTTQAGTVTTVAQTFAGKKTFDGGAAIKGDTTGNVIAQGYVGEVQRTFKSTATSLNVPALTFTNIKDNAGNDATITLGAGIWLITSQFSLGGNISTADNNKQVAISEYSGNTTTDHATGTNMVYTSNPTTALDGVSSLSFVVTNSTSKTYYAKVFLAVAASAAVIRFNVQAVRIA